MTPAQRAIVQAAHEAGINPAYALAVAERESSFNPQAHSSKTIHGLYQMRGDLRAKYGVGDSADPLEQARGWTRFLPDVKKDMGSVLGRDATDQESYLGHHFGARRAARMLKMDPSTPVEALFTPQEMRLNPHFARAGTVGKLNSSVMGDIGKRMARFGGDAPPTAEPADLSSFGKPVDVAEGVVASAPSGGKVTTSSAALPDLSSFGTHVDMASTGAAMPRNDDTEAAAPIDLSQFGTPVA
jgi:hypothetical protein